MPELGWELFSNEEKAELLAGMASGRATLAPRTIQIDWTDRCNVTCFFCSQAEIRRGGDELSPDVVERCFAEMDELGVRTHRLSFESPVSAIPPLRQPAGIIRRNARPSKGLSLDGQRSGRHVRHLMRTNGFLAQARCTRVPRSGGIE